MSYAENTSVPVERSRAEIEAIVTRYGASRLTREIRYFGPHREPAVLVEDFGELRTGMVVWVAPCPAPGCDKHRGILLDEMPEQPTVSVQTGGLNLLSGFSFVPPVHDAEESMLTAADVAHGAVFAVIDEPPAKAKSRTRGRTLENA